MPALLEVEGRVLVAEERRGILEAAGFGEFAGPVADVLRMIRALGGMVMA